MAVLDDQGDQDPQATRKLLLRARAGDRSAADELFAAAAERVGLFVQLRMGPALRAKMEPVDVIQETWVAVLEGLEDFESRGQGSFSAWVCRIAERRLASLARYGARAKRKLPGTEQAVSMLLDHARQSATGPFSHAVCSERGSQLSSAIEALEAKDREVLLMRHFEELTLDEISHRTGSSPSAVRRQLGRALALLGQSIGSGERPKS